MKGFPYIILILGFLLIGASIVAWLGGPAIFGEIGKGTSGEGRLDWRNASQFKMDNFLKVYFFNVTNPEDVIAGGKPKLQEVGPYVYEGNVTRIIESIDEDKDTATYKDVEQFAFRPDLTNGNESDNLIIINLPYVGLAQEVSKLSSFARIMVMGVITRFNEGLFMRKTARQLIFGGFKQELLATLASITGEQYMKDNKFGFYYERNNSNCGNYTVSMGEKETSHRGQIITWNNNTELKWWKSESCNNLGGSYDGTMFPAGITKTTLLALFRPEICRKFRFGFSEEINYHGIPAYRFTLLPEEFDDPRIRQENMCYCTNHGSDNLNCPKRGRYQINACVKEASISVSFPHFLYGDEEYLEMVDGYHPDKSLHESYMDIEPITGTLLKIVKRAQPNLELRPLRLFNEFRKVRKMVFPAIWTEETKELPAERVAELVPSSGLLKMSTFAGMSAGVILILVALYVLMMRMRNNRTKYNS